MFLCVARWSDGAAELVQGIGERVVERAKAILTSLEDWTEDERLLAG